MAEKHNIFDQSIREGFENFHPEPPAGVWEGVAKGIGSQAAGAGASTLAKAGIVGVKKILIALTAVAALGTTTYYLLPDTGKKESKTPATEIAVNDPANETAIAPSQTNSSIEENKGEVKTDITTSPVSKTIVNSSAKVSSEKQTKPAANHGVNENIISTEISKPSTSGNENPEPAPVVKETIIDQHHKEVYKADNAHIVVSDLQVCKGSEISFYVTLPDDARNAFILYGQGKAMAKKAVNNKEYVYFQAEETGVYTLALNWVAIDGKTYNCEKEVQVYEFNCELLINDLRDGSYQLDVVSEEANPEKVKWYLGDGEVEYGNTVTHQYINLEPTRYTVSAVSYDEHGCKDSIVKSLDNKYTADNLKPFFPNVFTPDGDGKNDQLEFVINNEESYYLQVFDKDGRLVFESRDKNVRWNGKMLNVGEACPTGTYLYIFNYKIKGDSEARLKRSKVSLIR